ncbi:hypothetical protein GALMADRAFT_120360 [Galerina marginata CBS 339.88]|uniref:Protein kinase domain-containing protein n=1 Tax=Galerina marginata (strain CBS 339.88) TaxID=685588 RepID=A0A067T251_GALM3|nr:hypothetical protein GALMADRAFT_120360 [Galerina marginata CBS 339.88]
MKPENILIDGRGNVKIGDFGLSHVSRTMLALDEGARYTDATVGTPGYVAPEAKSGEKYGIEVDYWALGCIFYGMVAGDRDEDDNVLAEFEDSDDLLEWAEALPTDESILKYYQNEGFDEDTLTLLCGLLNPHPERRLGIAGLIAHPYFQVNGRSEFSGMGESALERHLTTTSLTDHRPRIRYSPQPPDGTDFRWINPYGACVPVGVVSAR